MQVRLETRKERRGKNQLFRDGEQAGAQENINEKHAIIVSAGERSD
jgi:hypothetical protein